MNTAVSHYIWGPLKSVGRAYESLDRLPVQLAALAVFLAYVYIVASVRVSAGSLLAISIGAAIVSIVFYVRAYATKKSARTCWNLIMLGHLFGALFLASAFGGSWKYSIMYGAGILAAFVVGHICIWYLEMNGESTALRDYHGSVYAFAKLGNLFFIVCLLFMAFPISPSFLAQDILLSSIPPGHAFQIALFCLSYLLVGVSVVRLYAKVFFGPYKTAYHEIAYRSS